MSVVSEVTSFFNPTTALLRIGSILLIISLITSAYFYVQHLRGEVSTLQTQVDTAVAANKQQQGVIDDYNKQMSILQQQTVDLNKRLSDAQEKARILARPHYDAAKTIQKQINPKDTTDQLNKINNLLNGMIP